MSLVLNVEILGEFKKLTSATQGAQSSLTGLQDKIGGIAKGIGRAVGTLALALGFTGIVNGFQQAVKAAEEAAVANQRIDAIAKSMDEFGGQTAKVTKRIKDYADSQEFAVGVDGDVIKATQAKLLTFRELTKTADVMGGSFDRATIAALDMAAAGFGEATSNATQLGKALNDPIAGITALNRAGIQFTEEQKNLIKSLVESGDILKAQDIILREIENQVGGTSAATATASEKMTIAFGQVSEALGNVLLPVMEDMSNWIIETTPEITAFFDELNDPLSETGNAWFGLGQIFEQTGTEFNKMLAVFGLSEISFKDVLNFVTMLTAGFGQLFFFVGRVADIIGSVISLNFGRALDLAMSFGADYETFVSRQNAAIAPIATGTAAPRTGDRGAGNNIVINMNQGNLNPQDVANAINRASRNSGNPLIR